MTRKHNRMPKTAKEKREDQSVNRTGWSTTGRMYVGKLTDLGALDLEEYEKPGEDLAVNVRRLRSKLEGIEQWLDTLIRDLATARLFFEAIADHLKAPTPKRAKRKASRAKKAA